ncbi:dynactin subunit 6 isoform X2 [Anabrus simplex]
MTIIHPRAAIVAEAGPIIIGENNLIEEQAVIINRLPPGETPSSTPVLIIGANNVFEVDSHSEALKIGDNNILESKCFVGREVELTNGCIVGAACRLTCPEVVAENTVVFGRQCTRRQQADRPPAQTLQLDFLTRVLPNYHHLKKPLRKGQAV